MGKSEEKSLVLGSGDGVGGEVPRIFHDIGEEGGPRKKYDTGWWCQGLYGVRTELSNHNRFILHFFDARQRSEAKKTRTRGLQVPL